MSKTHPLVDIVLNLRSLADNFQALADIVTENEPAAAAQPEAPAAEKVPEPKTKPVKLEQVRAVLADKSQQGLTAGVRTLLEKYGAPKLSQIDPEHFSALLADAENLK